MPNRTRIRAIVLAVLMVGSVLATAGVGQAQTTPEITIEGPSDNELSGDETVTLTASNVADGDDIGSYQIDVEYNGTLLVVSTSDTEQFTVTDNQTGTDPATATIVGYTGSYDKTSGRVNLANIKLTAGDGTEGNVTQLKITDVTVLTDTDGNDLGSSIVQPGSFEIVEGTENVDPEEENSENWWSRSSDRNNESEEDEDTKDTKTPTIDEVREDLNQIKPNTETRSEITDSDPDRPGVNVRPEGTEFVRVVTFNEETVRGNVDTREWRNPPQSVSQSISGSVAETSAEGTTTETNVVAVADIEPDTDEARGSSGTVEVAAEPIGLENPEEAVIFHEVDGGWEQLETTVEETSNGEVTLVAETDSFSLFAIGEVEQTTQPDTGTDTQETDTGTDTPQEDSGLGAITIIGLLLIVVLIVAAIVGYSQKQ